MSDQLLKDELDFMGEDEPTHYPPGLQRPNLGEMPPVHPCYKHITEQADYRRKRQHVIFT
jgi:hypothetical protein